MAQTYCEMKSETTQRSSLDDGDDDDDAKIHVDRLPDLFVMNESLPVTGRSLCRYVNDITVLHF